MRDTVFRLRGPLLFALAIGTLAAGATAFLALNHNPQGAYYSDGTIHREFGLLLLVNFTAAFLPALLAATLVLGLFRWTRRLRRHP